VGCQPDGSRLEVTPIELMDICWLKYEVIDEDEYEKQESWTVKLSGYCNFEFCWTSKCERVVGQIESKCFKVPPFY
jgi:hypothetical protein